MNTWGKKCASLPVREYYWPHTHTYTHTALVEVLMFALFVSVSHFSLLSAFVTSSQTHTPRNTV